MAAVIRRALTTAERTPIEGLNIHRKFFSPDERRDIVNATNAIMRQVRTMLKKESEYKRTQNHYYEVPMPNGRGSVGLVRHFADDENGFARSCFVGSQHIPNSLLHKVIPRLQKISSVRTVSLLGALDWNMALSTHQLWRRKHRPFVREIKEYGQVNLITGCGQNALLRLREAGEKLIAYQTTLEDCDLVEMAGPARWNYEHCVIPIHDSKIPPIVQDGDSLIGRFSYAFGVKLKESDEEFWDLEKKACELIHGSRKYHDFTDEEKTIVDRYQDILIGLDARFILPNTYLSDFFSPGEND